MHKLVDVDPRTVLQNGEGFLFVDRVLDEGPGWVETEWVVEGPAGFFRGFGEDLYLPATFQTEHVVQSGELLIYQVYGATPESDGIGVLSRIRNGRYRRMVRPGDMLRTRVELSEQVGPAYYLSAVVRHGDGGKVLTCELAYTATTAAAIAQV